MINDQCKNHRVLQGVSSFWGEEVYIHTCIWKARRSLTRQSFRWKMHFTASWTWKVSVLKTKTMYCKFVKCYLVRLLWRLTSKRCFTVSGWVWDLLKYVLKALYVTSSSFLHSTWISIAGLIEDSFWILWTWSKA